MKGVDGMIGMGGGEGEVIMGEGERGKRGIGMDRMIKEGGK